MMQSFAKIHEEDCMFKVVVPLQMVMMYFAFEPACTQFLFMQEETNKTPASARHKRGCNCKKSSCLKKYCECFQVNIANAS
jgi:hypothetical protein